MEKRTKKIYFWADDKKKILYVVKNHKYNAKEKQELTTIREIGGYELKWADCPKEIIDTKEMYYSKENIENFLKEKKGEEEFNKYLAEAEAFLLDENGEVRYNKKGQPRKRGFVGARTWFITNFKDEFKEYMESKKK